MRPKYIGDITQRAYNGFEERLTYDEMLEFLKNPLNFMTVGEGLKRDLLENLDFQCDESEAISTFKAVVREYGFTASEMQNFDIKVHEWFNGNKRPKIGWAVRLCFAFKLNEEQAGHFLWKVCRLNGFCYRNAIDVICCYCLANEKSYRDARVFIDRFKANLRYSDVNEYKKIVLNRIKKGISDYTESTQTIIDTFKNLKGMSESDFEDKLFSLSKYFLDYSISAHDGIVAQYTAVKEQLKKDRPVDIGLSDTIQREQVKDGKIYTTYSIESLSKEGTYKKVDGNNIEPIKFDGQYELSYSFVWNELSKRNKLIFGTEDHEIRPTRPITEVCDHVQELVMALPTVDRLITFMKDSRPQSATEKELCSARNVFVFLFFAQYVLRWERYLYDITTTDESPEEFFSDFYESLNNALENCGYGYLYYANPFDWHILSCVRLLDINSGEDDEMSALTQFNEALAQLAED
ncbi:MAG: hypothetical protein FWC32_09495 [Firmicutes bacterium]|nr:hypothetical protein [Bacillota bacterium]